MTTLRGRRGRTLGVAIGLALLLTGCGGGADDSEAASDQGAAVTGEQATAEAASPGDPENGVPLRDDVAIMLFREVSFWGSAEPETLASWAETVCSAYDTGGEPQGTTLAILKTATDAGMPAEDVGSSLVYATGWKCPEHYEASRIG